MATGNMNKNSVKFGGVVFELCGDETDRQTYSSQYFAPLPAAK